MQILTKGRYFNSELLSAIPAWHAILYAVLFNTIIALLVSSQGNGNFLNSFVMSQSFGLTISISFIVYDRYLKLSIRSIWAPVLLGTSLGYFIGVIILHIINEAPLFNIADNIMRDINNVGVNFLIATFFGMIIIYFLVTRSHVINVSNELDKEKLKTLDYEKRMAESRLRLLQAQIEPHFLFNTLSNVSSLIDINPDRSKLMLESLTRYLRSALHRSRKSGTTMQQEIELIRDYLDIIQMRMGDRLKYEIDISDNLLNIRFPPMLLQPLVENAIKHGLEPSEHGGTVKISGTINESRTNLSVTDTGLGLRAETVSGFGLVNVRERLLSIYDNKAKLHIKENEPTGVMATIEIPNEAN